jgi:tetratricopeptide (TPR) repeat protein
LLLAIGLWVRHRGSERQIAEAHTYATVTQLLQDGQFAKVHEFLANSAAKGIDSPRLKSLETQATREIPDAHSLAYAGRLTDFGYDPSTGPITKDFGPNWDQIARERVAASPLAKGAGQALDQLMKIDAADLDLLLNRGHVLLTLGDVERAAADFGRATTLDPQRSLAWLGSGLAKFAQGNYADATAAFREAQRLDPKDVSVAINLAMSLQREGKLSAALYVWVKLLDLPLSPADRRLAQGRIERLHASETNKN